MPRGRKTGDASLASDKVGIGRHGAPSAMCKGRTVIRYQQDVFEGKEMVHRKGDPILDEDNSRQYRPCAAWAANGTEYCTAHGGATPAAIAAARRTIMLATPNAAEVLSRLLNDEDVAPETRIKAAVQLLDRGGVRAGVDISLEAPAWQKLMGDMFGEAESAEDTAKPDVAPTTPKEETKPAPRRRKAAPPAARPKFEGWE